MIIRKNISFPLKAGGAVTLKLFAAPASSAAADPAIAGVEPRRGENLRVVVTKTKLTILWILAGIGFLLKALIKLNETGFDIQAGADMALLFNVIFCIEESGIFKQSISVKITLNMVN